MLKPWNKERDNAVELAAFGVVFSGGPSPEELRALAGHLLSHRGSHERARVAVPGGWNQLDTGNLPPLGGIWLEYKGQGDGLSAIGMGNADEGNFSLTVHFSSYAGWGTVWDGAARPIFLELLPKVPDRLSVLRTELLFVGRFVWSGHISGFNLDSVFRSGTLGFAPLLSGPASFWRSQNTSSESLRIGQVQLDHMCIVEISSPNSQLGASELDVRIDISVNQGLHCGEQQPNVDPRTLLEPERLDQQMNRMHDKNKDILRRLLTDEACESINLEGVK